MGRDGRTLRESKASNHQRGHATNISFYQVLPYHVWPDFNAASTWAFPRSISTLTIELCFISAATVGLWDVSGLEGSRGASYDRVRLVGFVGFV